MGRLARRRHTGCRRVALRGAGGRGGDGKGVGGVTLPCSFCGAPWHPATGCYYGPRIRSCYRCTVEFWVWFRRHQHARSGRPDFYGAASRWFRGA